MSFIRLLALSYLAWAAVFVVTVILVAHLPLPGNTPAATGARAHKTENAATRLPPGKPELHMVARLDLMPVAPLPGPAASSDVSPPQPPVAPEPEAKPIQSPPVAAATPPVSPLSPRRPSRNRAQRHSLILPPAPVPVARPHRRCVAAQAPCHERTPEQAVSPSKDASRLCRNRPCRGRLRVLAGTDPICTSARAGLPSFRIHLPSSLANLANSFAPHRCALRHRTPGNAGLAGLSRPFLHSLRSASISRWRRRHFA